MVRGKSPEDPVRREARALIEMLCEATGLKPTQLAKAAEVAPSTVNKILQNVSSHTLSMRTIHKLLEASRQKLEETNGEPSANTSKREKLRRDAKRIILNPSLSSLFHRTFDAPPTKDIIAPTVVLGSVQAGEWKEALEWPDEDRYTVYVPKSLRFPSARRFGLEIVGPSMNRVYPEKTIVICVPLPDIDREPKSGERVVVQRRNNQGLIEATVKEYQRDESGKAWLWPRSHHPEHQTPIALGTAESIEITALVDGAYTPESEA